MLEIGSLYQPGYEELCNLRRYFPGREYVGCDIRYGLGVDRVDDAQSLSFRSGSLGTLLLFEILEHLPDPALAIKEAARVLADDGMLALSVPFNYRLHGFPADYWRFTPSGIYRLLSNFPDKVIFALGPRLKPAFVFAVATKKTSATFTLGKLQFQSAVDDTFRRSLVKGHMSVFKERARDFWGHLLGRAELSVNFFDPMTSGGYVKHTANTRESSE